MYRTKLSIARNGVIAAALLITCYYLFSNHASPSVWKNFSPTFRVAGSSRVCPDPNEPDYFQKLAKSVNVSARLDVSEFSFFIADVSGRLTDAKATRRGIIALRSFDAGDTLMQTSLDSMFSIDQIHRSKISHLMPVFRELGMNDMSILIVTLMYEFSNPPSAWDAYICTIPPTFTTTTFWSARELSEAAAVDPRVKEFTTLRKNEYATRYNDYIPYLTKRYPKLFPASFFNFQNYLWAATACYSRNWVVNDKSVPPSQTHIMVPVLDLVNHQEPSNYVSYDADRRVFSIIAGPNGIKEGSEVMLSYGEKCNARLLTDYGFAVAENPNNPLPECS